MNELESIKEELTKNIIDYYNIKKDLSKSKQITVAGVVYDSSEMLEMLDCILTFWLTSGDKTTEFENELKKFLNIKYCSFVNSGSSANLLAFMSLTSPLLGDRKIKRNDEIITVASCFPTTISPIIQYGAIPVFVDIEIPSYNIDISKLEKALSNKTKAVILAHTLGNPFNIQKVKEFCDKNNLWLIEDNCDALGSKYFYDNEWKFTGTIGDIGTSSFYPAHHMTTGEGGAVYTNNPLLHKIINSFRDWGRDCWCNTGKDNTCHKRFEQKFSNLPIGYDHKYVYSHFGYNLKASEIQAAIGLAQIKKLNDFIKTRKDNWNFLKLLLTEFEDHFILPNHDILADPSWFGFLITIKSDEFTKLELIKYLEENNIQTRALFTGNILKHPCFDDLKINIDYRVIDELKNTDITMNNTFWIGIHQDLKEEDLMYIHKTIKNFLK